MVLFWGCYYCIFINRFFFKFSGGSYFIPMFAYTENYVPGIGVCLKELLDQIDACVSAVLPHIDRK